MTSIGIFDSGSVGFEALTPVDTPPADSPISDLKPIVAWISPHWSGGKYQLGCDYAGNGKLLDAQRLVAGH